MEYLRFAMAMTLNKYFPNLQSIDRLFKYITIR